MQDKKDVAVLQRDLDRGEAETIALALEMGADLVLLDEREGRHMAQRLGLEVIGRDRFGNAGNNLRQGSLACRTISCYPDPRSHGRRGKLEGQEG